MTHLTKPVKILTFIILLSAASAAVQSCSCSESPSPKQEKVSDKVQDKKAYALGQEHARGLLETVDSEDRTQDGLLEIRARISNIESKLGRQSAVDYERGFTDYVRANCDSLARIIF